MGADWGKPLEAAAVKEKIICFLKKSDYDFYKEMSEGMTEEEFGKFCIEFPEARVVRR
ncbi:MAG: hypothetical protein HFG60_02850 [Lachnospiraceae bacterium]|nr:hypothetical protein [Lachnospiraceae bacterium]MCI9183701.1 hypothetical protein [Lachnospiraceae bacterium]